MSVLIRGMEMPATCSECPLLEHVEASEDHKSFCYCRLDNWGKPSTPEWPMSIQHAQRFRRLYCPLEELPSFGKRAGS